MEWAHTPCSTAGCVVIFFEGIFFEGINLVIITQSPPIYLSLLSLFIFIFLYPSLRCLKNDSLSNVLILFFTYSINPTVSSVRGTVLDIVLRHFKLGPRPRRGAGSPEILVFVSFTFFAGSYSCIKSIIEL